MNLCKVKIDKKVGSSDWNKDLSEISDKEQLTYAANDVRYLKTIKDKLQTMLEAKKDLNYF